MSSGDVPHIPVLRFGKAYESLDTVEVKDHRTGTPVANVGQANPGIVRRDLKKLAGAARVLGELSASERFELCAKAEREFLEGTLPLNDAGATQTPEQYVATLSATSGMPYPMIRANMAKVATVLRDMPDIIRGLTRGMDPAVIDDGIGEHGGVPVSYSHATDGLGVILPSNSPGVNSIWIPSIALKTPVVLKPGREEPWTPLRIIRAFLAAGCPPEAFGFYPTSHEGAGAILERCQRSQLFGDERTTAPYVGDPRVEIHGPGRSKVILDETEAARFEDHLDVLVQSIAANGGRSCINASAIFTPSRGDELARALAERMAAIEPLPLDHDDAPLCAFANPAFRDYIDQAIESGIQAGGAEDVTATLRDGPRAVERDGSSFLRPTVVRCRKPDHPLANTEFLFPYASVVEVPQAELVSAIGPSLVVTAITRDQELLDELLRSPHVERLNIGPLTTARVDWDQPHEGNLFEFLFTRRAIARHAEW